MKTKKYIESLESVLKFCEMAEKGIVICEVNDYFTKESLIMDLKNSLNADLCHYVFLGNNGYIHDDSSNLIVRFDIKDDLNKIVVNLNYNRDWLMSLNKTIIFIAPSILVNQLIEYSYNFWSFVSVHEIFNPIFKCIITPYFIDDFFSFYESETDKTRRISSYKMIFENEPRLAYVFTQSFNEKSNVYKKQDIIPFLNRKINDITKQEDYYELVDRIMDICQNLYKEEMFHQANEVFLFANKNRILLTIIADNLSIRIRYYDLLAKNCFRIKKYYDTINIYTRLINLIENTNFEKYSVFITNEKKAEWYNNCGVSFCLLDKWDDALYWINKSAKLYYDLPLPYQFGETMFNYSILSYMQMNNIAALEYIEKAIECVNSIDSRWYSITKARYGVLKAYLLINMGELDKSYTIIYESLNMLRNQIIENHIYVLESHYVYALYYLYIGDVEHSLSCAYKALNISDRINNIRVKPHLWELIGEIYYEKGNQDKAIHYLKKAYIRAKDKNIFDPLIMQWMYDIITKKRF